jgi:TPR repeat protein
MNVFTRSKLKRLGKKVALMHKHRQANQVDNAALAKEIKFYKQIATIYDKYNFDKQCPDARNYALENYRAAASLNDSEAQYIVGQRLMAQGTFWVEMKDTIYNDEAHDVYAKHYFKESVAFLRKAKENESILAERLLGVAYINGWGVELDVDEGSKLLVSSIDKENAWERASEIFTGLGLNKPEFFSKLMMMKGKE